MKLTFLYSAFALVASVVFASDRETENNENSSNNSKTSILDFEITDENPVQKGILALMMNSCDVDFSLAYDNNLLSFHFPPDLLSKIIFATQHNYRRLAQTSKLIYHNTRPIHYQCMKTLILRKSELANGRFRKYFGKSSRNMVLKAKIALYMTLLADEGNLDVWVADTLEANRQNLATICSLLKAQEPFTGIIGPKLLGLLREAVVQDRFMLYSLVLQCSEEDDAMFTREDLSAIVRVNSNMATKRKQLVLSDLLLARDDLLVEKRIISDSIHQSLWSAISSATLANAPIHDIARWMNCLSKENAVIMRFKRDFIFSLHWTLINVANLYAARLKRENIEIEPDIKNMILDYRSEYFLLDEKFCKRHQFSESDCVDLFKQVNHMTLMEALIEKFDPTNEWSRRLIHRLAEQFPIEDHKKSLDCLLILGKPVEDFEGTLEPLVVAKMAAGLHPMCQYARPEQIRYIVKKSLEALLPHIGDPVAISMHLPIYAHYEFMRLMTSTQIELAAHEAIATRRFYLFENLVSIAKKSFFKLLLEHVNQNPDFDCAKTQPEVHILLVLLSSNEEFRNKHLEGVCNKNTKSLSKTLRTSTHFLKKAQFERVSVIIKSLKRKGKTQ